MIGLDANLFIYLLEGNQRFGELARNIFSAIEQGTIKACASEITFLEVLSYRLMTNGVATKAKDELKNLGVTFQPVTEEILLSAANLRRKYGLGTMDAVHVASAKASNCGQFVTNNQQLLQRNIPGIKLIPLQADLSF